MKNLKKGFTLIELLVVIAIIGILATTLAPKLREQLAKAKDSKAVALLGAARTAASVVLVDKMVQDTSGSAVTITQTEIEKKLDSKTGDMLNDSDSTIAIGGSRASADGDMIYGKTVILVSSGTAISVSGGISASGDDINLTLTKGTGAGDFSTEGKEWSEY